MSREHAGPHDVLSVLERQDAITASARRMLEQFARRWQVSPFHAILMTQVIDEVALADALAAGLGIERKQHVRSLPRAEEALKVIGFKRARAWEAMAVQGPRGATTLVFADPTQNDRIDLLRRELNSGITLSVAERSDIVGAIDELFPLATQLPSLFSE